MQQHLCLASPFFGLTNPREITTAVFKKSSVWKAPTTLKYTFIECTQCTVDPCVPEWVSLKPIERSGKPYYKTIEEHARTLQSLPEIFKFVIQQVVQPILTKVQIDWVNDPRQADVRIQFCKNAGSWSLIGSEARGAPWYQATLNIGWLDVGTIIHEFCHSLGMLHEHQNPRGKPIQWNKEKVYEWAAQTQGWSRQETDTQILIPASMDTTNGSEFDPQSIMLYFFSPELTLDGESSTPNYTLSNLDQVWLQKYYGDENARVAETSSTPPQSKEMLHKTNFIVIISIVVVILLLLLLLVRALMH